MPSEGLETYSKDQLIEELINRQTFAGIVVYCRGDAKAGRLEPGEIVITKSPPLAREGVDHLLQVGQTLIPRMFGEETIVSVEGTPKAFPSHTIPPPLRTDQGGVVRIGNSRVSLDLIVEQYENGMTPEDMVRAYDTLVLADVHAAVAYYLRYGDEVQSYLMGRKQEAERLRTKIESERPRVSREELLERQSA